MSLSIDTHSFDNVPVHTGHDVLERLRTEYDPDHIYAAVSGGDDSITALHFAANSNVIDLDGVVHMDTGIGVRKTREFVEEKVEEMELDLVVLEDQNARFGHERYEHLVKTHGFPGANPVAHSQMWKNLKDKPLNKFRRHLDGDLALISGVRRFESNTRYERLDHTGVQEVSSIIWASPLVDFTDMDLKTYRDHHDIEENPVAALLCSSGECLCLDPDTLISTEHGWEEIKNVDEGDSVYSLQNGNTELTEVMEKHVQDPIDMVKINPYYRPEIKATANHPFYVRPYEFEYDSDWRYKQSISGPEWVEAGEIVEKTHESADVTPINKERFYIGTPFRTKESPVDLTDSELSFLGYFVAEGAFQWRPKRDSESHGVVFILSRESQELAENIQESFQNCFPDIEMAIEETEDPRDGREYYRLRTGEPEVSQFIERWVKGRYSDELELDQRLMTASIDQQKTLIDAMWMGDGSEYRRERDEHPDEKVSAYGTTSKSLALQVQEILLRAGDVYGINHSCNDSFQVRQTVGEPEYGFIENNILWCLVQDVKEVGASERHNLTVRDKPNFITETGLVHNCGAYGDRNNLPLIKKYFPEVAQQIFRLEWDVLERVARGEIPKEYALWAHGSVDSGEYDARTDSGQTGLMCSDCDDHCPSDGYQMTGNPVSPAEEFLRSNDLSEFWNWPFYCAKCDRVVQDPYSHRQEVHPFDAEAGLEAEWDIRKIEVGVSDRTSEIVTEPNGWNIHVNYLTTDRSEAEGSKHKHYYEDVEISLCDHGDHDWEPYNGGPVKQCTECFAFNLTDYDPEDPGPPVVAPESEMDDVLTPDEEEAQEINQQLSKFI